MLKDIVQILLISVQKLYLFRDFEFSRFRDYLFWVLSFDIHLEFGL